MKVLIVENDFVSSKVMDKALRKWHYEVVSVTEGREAWEIITSDSPPSIVVLNLMMPDMDGLELVGQIRSYKTPSYIFTLILTSKSAKEDIVRGIETGADDYLTKPFYHGELLARVRAGERVVQLEQTLAEQNAELQKTNDILLQTNLRMKRDLDAAAKIQQTLLPHRVPEIRGINIEWFYKPCEELGGDTLNVFMLDDKHLGFFVLDVSGHGVSAALLSVSLSRILSPLENDSSVLRKKLDDNGGYQILRPSEVANKLNKRFIMDDDSQQYFTLLYGMLDLNTFECQFVSAGQPNLLLLSGGDAPTTLEHAGVPIGFFEDVEYVDNTIHLRPGDRLYLYSDGVNEAVDENNEQFGLFRTIQSFQTHCRESLPDSIHKTIARVESWSNEKLRDDISMLAIEVTTNPF